MRLFLSYSHDDSELVDEIVALLDEEVIISFSYREHIIWGDEFLEVIESNLAEAEATHVMLILSPASVMSAWVAYEAGQARARGKKILPFLTHPCLEVPPFLRHLQYISSQNDLRAYFRLLNN